ncbi:hypothetical protein, partial [Mesotoga sp. UBA5847]|uniref:hypothetical protein n=1 Tax=Mesotoga sp. UBA5847 TaxID=1946859 RepID=UPI0025FCFAA0
LKDPLYARSSALRLKAVNPLYAVKYDSPLTVREERSVLRSEDLFFVLGKGHIGRAWHTLTKKLSGQRTELVLTNRILLFFT